MLCRMCVCVCAACLLYVCIYIHALSVKVVKVLSPNRVLHCNRSPHMITLVKQWHLT